MASKRTISWYFRPANWPLWVKIAVAPGMALALLAAAVGAGSLVQNRQSALIEQVVSRDMKGSLQLADIARRISAVQTRLYRLFTFEAAGIQPALRSSRMQDLLNEIDAVRKDVETARDAATGHQKESLDKLAQDLDAYRTQVQFVGPMLAIDFASAASFIVPFDESYTAMNEELTTSVHAMVAEAERDTQRGVRETTAFAASMMFGTLMALLIVGLFTLTSMLTTRRATIGIAIATKALAKGDDNVDLESLKRSDELGAIVRSLEVFRENQRRLKAMREEQDQMRLQQDQMRKQNEEERKAMLAKVADNFEKQFKGVVASVTEQIAHMNGTASQMAALAETAQRRAGDIAAAADDTSGNVQVVASAAEELSASIAEIGGQVDQSHAIAGQAVTQARRADERLAGLTDAARQIGGVLDLISDIAAQTNLLALNATIEAARAGEAGRGFAVVAAEVKQLATQTGQASQDISAKIAAMRASTDATVGDIREISRVIDQINMITASIAGAVEQQNAATREIASNVNRAASNTRRSSEGVADFGKLAVDVETASGSVLGAADDLNHQAVALRAEIERFLGSIRAA